MSKAACFKLCLEITILLQHAWSGEWRVERKQKGHTMNKETIEKAKGSRECIGSCMCYDEEDAEEFDFEMDFGGDGGNDTRLRCDDGSCWRKELEEVEDDGELG